MNDGSLQVQCPQRLKREHPIATQFLRTMSDYDDHRMHLRCVVVLLNFHCTYGSIEEELDLDHPIKYTTQAGTCIFRTTKNIQQKRNWYTQIICLKIRD